MSFTPTVTWANANEKEENQRTRWSNFWIMINTNKAGDNIVERSHLITNMRRIIDEIFSDKKTLISILRAVDEGGKEGLLSEARARELNKIESVVSEAVVEVGPKKHRVHAHLLVMIQHKTRIQIDVAKLRDLVREKSKEDGEYLIGNPVVRLRVIRENPINAIRLYQRGYKNKLPGSLINKVSQGLKK